MAQDGEAEAVVTIHAVARRAGVSTATVSRVLSGSASAAESTRAKVLAAARELDYLPRARSRPQPATRHETHALVLADLAGFYHSELVMGHESVASERGQSLGRLAATQLDGRIVGGQPVSSPQVLPTQLVIRSSCGCPALSPSTDD